MSLLDDIRDDATKLQQYAAFAATIQAATGIGGTTATEVVAIVRAALAVLAAGAAGTLSSDRVLAEFNKLTGGEAADDAAAAAVLAGRDVGGA